MRGNPSHSIFDTAFSINSLHTYSTEAIRAFPLITLPTEAIRAFLSVRRFPGLMKFAIREQLSVKGNGTAMHLPSRQMLLSHSPTEAMRAFLSVIRFSGRLKIAIRQHLSVKGNKALSREKASSKGVAVDPLCIHLSAVHSSATNSTEIATITENPICTLLSAPCTLQCSQAPSHSEYQMREYQERRRYGDLPPSPVCNPQFCNRQHGDCHHH